MFDCSQRSIDLPPSSSTLFRSRQDFVRAVAEETNSVLIIAKSIATEVVMHSSAKQQVLRVALSTEVPIPRFLCFSCQESPARFFETTNGDLVSLTFVGARSMHSLYCPLNFPSTRIPQPTLIEDSPSSTLSSSTSPLSPRFRTFHGKIRV